MRDLFCGEISNNVVSLVSVFVVSNVYTLSQKEQSTFGFYMPLILHANFKCI